VIGGVMPTRSDVIVPNSREHWAMYENEPGQWYARAGRFYPIYGVRTQDHTSFPRRHLQMYLYEEPYGAAWGKFMPKSELHISAFMKAPEALFGNAHDNGVAAYYEKRNEEDTAVYGAQTRITFSDTDRRARVGGVYKRWMEDKKLLFLGEADLGIQAFPEEGGDSPAPLYELLVYASATYFAKEGLMVSGTLQHFDYDVAHRATARDAVDLDVQFFPIPHLELHLLTRVELLAADFGRPVILALTQIHYYL
jgi:hypothetical protein